MSSNTDDIERRREQLTIFRAVPDETVHEIAENARDVSPDDPRVTDSTAGLVPITETGISRAFFALGVAREPDMVLQCGEDQPITIWVYESVGTPDGDADVMYRVEADPESHEVRSLTVRADLVRPA